MPQNLVLNTSQMEFPGDGLPLKMILAVKSSAPWQDDHLPPDSCCLFNRSIHPGGNGTRGVAFTTKLLSKKLDKRSPRRPRLSKHSKSPDRPRRQTGGPALGFLWQEDVLFHPTEKTDWVTVLYINGLNAEGSRVAEGARRENKYWLKHLSWA